MLRMLCLGVAVVIGVAAEANGLFMLVSPEHWYFSVPGIAAPPQWIELSGRLGRHDLTGIELGLDQRQNAILDLAQHVVKPKQSCAIRSRAMAGYHNGICIDHRKQFFDSLDHSAQ
jgi:hypothetical protein